LLWVDGSLVQFDRKTSYPVVGNDIPTRDDLAPAGIGSRGAEVSADHLVLKRDVYYIADRVDDRNSVQSVGISDYLVPEGVSLPNMHELVDFFAQPDRWTQNSLFGWRREVTFPLEADQFFVLGDNSPQSKDSRLWAEGKGNEEFFVKRELL